MEDQHKEPKQEQEGEPTDQRKEEEEKEAEAAKPEEQTDQRKGKEEPEVDKSEELTDQRKAETERISEEESMEDSSPFVHPCSQLLQFVARACAWCLGMPDSLDEDGGATRPGAAPAASLNSSREISLAAVNKASGITGFNMQERFTGVLVQLRRLQPGTNNPREGRGAKGGVHH